MIWAVCEEGFVRAFSERPQLNPETGRYIGPMLFVMRDIRFLAAFGLSVGVTPTPIAIDAREINA